MAGRHLQTPKAGAESARCLPLSEASFRGDVAQAIHLYGLQSAE